MIDEELTSKLALLLYDVYEVNYLTCLAIQEMEGKADKYDAMMDNPTEWYTAGMKEATKDIARLEEENQILKDLASLIKSHMYSGGITDIELDEGTEAYEIVHKAMEVIEDDIKGSN